MSERPPKDRRKEIKDAALHEQAIAELKAQEVAPLPDGMSRETWAASFKDAVTRTGIRRKGEGWRSQVTFYVRTTDRWWEWSHSWTDALEPEYAAMIQERATREIKKALAKPDAT